MGRVELRQQPSELQVVQLLPLCFGDGQPSVQHVLDPNLPNNVLSRRDGSDHRKTQNRECGTVLQTGGTPPARPENASD